jgi:hypothetical protein
MTETFKKAQHIMKLIANAAASAVAYEKFNAEEYPNACKTFSNKEPSPYEGQAKHYTYWVKHDGFDYIKKETDSKFWHDVFKLNYDERFSLGFRQWDDDKEHLLIPLWIVECLPDDFDIEVNSIGGRTCSIKDIDKDIRCGCVAYMA